MSVMLSLQQIETLKVSNNGLHVSVEDRQI